MSGPAKSPYLKTEPAPHERCYEMSVLLPALKAHTRYRTFPWIRISANEQTEDIGLAAGIRIERYQEDGS